MPKVIVTEIYSHIFTHQYVNDIVSYEVLTSGTLVVLPIHANISIFKTWKSPYDPEGVFAIKLHIETNKITKIIK